MTDDRYWYADKKLKLEAAETALDKALVTAVTRKLLASFRARVARYKALITMGPERASLASTRANETMGRNTMGRGRRR